MNVGHHSKDEKMHGGVISFRAARFGDVPKAAELFNACSQVQIGRDETNQQEVESDWRTPGFDLTRSTRVAVTRRQQLVGYVDVWDLSSVPVTPWIWGRVHPEYEGRGIGRKLMNWAESRARVAIDRVPDNARVAFRTGAVRSYRPPHRLFASLGMQEVRRFYNMVIALKPSMPAPEWPDGIRVSTFAQKPDLGAVYNAMDDAFKDHWGHVPESPEAGLARWRHWIESDRDFDPELWFVAMDGEEIAGICLCQNKRVEDPEEGYIRVLGVRRPWRRHGLATALLNHAFRELQIRGRFRAALGVDGDSLTGAVNLYKKAGMHVRREFLTYEKVLRSGDDLSTRSPGPPSLVQ